MQLDVLRVLHFHKGSFPGVVCSLGADSISGAFYLDTCQRILWVCTAEEFERLNSLYLDGVSVLSGSNAYEFLLRVATGLESQVVGETDVFGQLKEAWKKSSPALSDDVNFWIQKVFEDTKEIRSRHLEHLGGVSYGTLVRKFLKDRAAQGPVLLVGAGQLAQSVAPYLNGLEVWIWNRSVDKARVLAQEISGTASKVKVLETAEDEAEGWKHAAQALVCIPADASLDGRRIENWMQGSSLESRTLLHLGVQQAQAGEWLSITGALFLDDLFELQKAQGEARSIQVGHAMRACEERAKLRSLGSSVSIHHGWEDLAVFAV